MCVGVGVGMGVIERWVNVHIQSKLLQHTPVVGLI